MEIDPVDLAQADDDNGGAKDKAKSRLNAMVAITVALLATFMGICKVKDDNIVQAMQQAQADKIDNWGFYQAKNTQSKLFHTQAQEMQLQALSQTGSAKEFAAKAAADFEKTAQHEDSEKGDIRKKAEDSDKQYDALNYHDDQFDLSDTLLALSISLLAVTSLTQKRFLFVIAMVPTVAGVYLGICGLFGLTGPWTHPDALIKLLS